MRGPHSIAVTGSLRAGSLTTSLLKLVTASLDPEITFSFVDHVGQLPLYNADLDGQQAPRIVEEVRSVTRSSDGIMIAVPEYNASIPGGLKNWLDWVSRPPKVHALVGKPVLLVGGSPGPGGAHKSLTWLNDILQRLGAFTTLDPLSVPDLATALGPPGSAPSPDLLRRVHDVSEAWSTVLKHRRSSDSTP